MIWTVVIGVGVGVDVVLVVVVVVVVGVLLPTLIYIMFSIFVASHDDILSFSNHAQQFIKHIESAVSCPRYQ